MVLGNEHDSYEHLVDSLFRAGVSRSGVIEIRDLYNSSSENREVIDRALPAAVEGGLRGNDMYNNLVESVDAVMIGRGF